MSDFFSNKAHLWTFTLNRHFFSVFFCRWNRMTKHELLAGTIWEGLKDVSEDGDICRLQAARLARKVRTVIAQIHEIRQGTKYKEIPIAAPVTKGFLVRTVLNNIGKVWLHWINTTRFQWTLDDILLRLFRWQMGLWSLYVPIQISDRSGWRMNTSGTGASKIGALS